jgi:hypothetical protein
MLDKKNGVDLLLGQTLYAGNGTLLQTNQDGSISIGINPTGPVIFNDITANDISANDISANDISAQSVISGTTRSTYYQNAIVVTDAGNAYASPTTLPAGTRNIITSALSDTINQNWFGIAALTSQGVISGIIDNKQSGTATGLGSSLWVRITGSALWFAVPNGASVLYTIANDGTNNYLSTQTLTDVVAGALANGNTSPTSFVSITGTTPTVTLAAGYVGRRIVVANNASGTATLTAPVKTNATLTDGVIYDWPGATGANADAVLSLVTKATVHLQYITPVDLIVLASYTHA